MNTAGKNKGLRAYMKQMKPISYSFGPMEEQSFSVVHPINRGGFIIARNEFEYQFVH
jgi:hypothetical protein